MSEQDVRAYPVLKELPTADLVLLLAVYAKTGGAMLEADRDFIEAIQAELKTRKL